MVTHKQLHVCVLGLAVLYFVGWIVALAGIAAVQQKSTVTWAYSLEWFVVFWQLLLIVAIMGLYLTGQLYRVRAAMTGLLLSMSAIWLIFASEAYKSSRSSMSRSVTFTTGAGQSYTFTPINPGSRFNDDDDGGANSARYNTVVAGASIIFIGNVLANLILTLETHQSTLPKPLPAGVAAPVAAAAPTVQMPTTSPAPL